MTAAESSALMLDTVCHVACAEAARTGKPQAVRRGLVCGWGVIDAAEPAEPGWEVLDTAMPGDDPMGLMKRIATGRTMGVPVPAGVPRVDPAAVMKPSGGAIEPPPCGAPDRISPRDDRSWGRQGDRSAQQMTLF